MSPTRRDLIKYVAGGTVAAALAAVPGKQSEAAPAEPEVRRQSWTISAPIMLDCDDGRRLCILIEPERTIVHSYPADPLVCDDYQSVWIEGPDNEVLTAMTRMVGNGIVVALEEAGAIS